MCSEQKTCSIDLSDVMAFVELEAVENITFVQNIQTLLQTYMITEQLMSGWLIVYESVRRT